jgi:putative flippase GtrA
MRTFIKAQASLIIGSLADYAVTILLVEIFHCWYLLSNLAGNISGAILQFLLSRNWAFAAGEKNLSPQIIKFILVWIGSLVLSAAAVYLLTHFLGFNYLLSKTISSVLLGLTYQYILQKKFVFS